ncbi:MAG TPA: crosslink repair DNA glycosylase YcaQ family protein, partial [Ktedonobacteraceae bacterium]
VLQARVPDYCVDDWQIAAYQDHLLYDSWDKQACLVPISDWPLRAILREMYRPYHDREILQADPETATKILAAIDRQGPLSSLEFEDRLRIADAGSWSGTTRTKRVLRAMWVCGILVTHHRRNGRHYYDRPERVIPEAHISTPLLEEKDTYHRWIIGRRFQAVGLLRANAEAAIWSACGESAIRKQAIAELLEEGALTPVAIEGKNWTYYLPTSALPLLESPSQPERVIFLGPLDSFLWDRKGVEHIFDFDYTWEVYKPESLRKWGYYVLPVFYKDRFIGRLDSRLEQQTWTIHRWWWEKDIVPDADLLTSLQIAAARFLRYLRAKVIRVHESVDKDVRAALLKVEAHVA